MDLATLSSIFANAYIMYCAALGGWAGLLALRNQPLSGAFFGASWLASGLALISLIVGIMRAIGVEQFRAVFWLYEIYFIIVMPGLFALLKGRDDRQAAWTFAGVAIFTALASISTIQRNVTLNPLLLLPFFN
jgi:hypothetical protein